MDGPNDKQIDRPNASRIDGPNETKGVRILSFDGGGPGCFSQLVILEEVMSRIAHDQSIDKKTICPADYFDLMGGVGFGAYTAFMLGSLRLTVKDAMKELHALGKKLEGGAAKSPLGPDEATRILKHAIQGMLVNYDIPPDEALDGQRFSSSTCKVALLAVRTTSIDSCQWFRTYSSRNSDIECSVVEALCASMALMTVFSPVVERDIAYQLYDVGAYMRLNVDHGLENLVFHDWSQLGKVTSHTKQYLHGTPVAKLIDAAIVALIQCDGVMPLGQLTRTTRVKRQVKTPPAVSPYFVVRKEHWETIETSLEKPQGEGLRTLVLTGMGGCGKTQIISYFVQNYSSRFKHVFFIDASSQSSIKNDLRNAIRAIDGHQQDTDEEALYFLAENPESLLIFDNADDPNVDLVPFFPKSYKGVILITSRLRSLGELATLHHIELGPMSQEQAIETLAKASRRSLPVSVIDARYMNELVEELGCLALALVQAGVYIFNMGTFQGKDPQSSIFQQYLSLFQRGRAELMRKEGTASLDQYKRGVYSTLDLSYGLLSPLVREFLGLCSQFHYSNIPLSMILAAANRDFEDKKSYSQRPESHGQIKGQLRKLLCPGGSWSELHIRDIIQSLSSVSLVQLAVANDAVLLRFHPLVHSWAREMLSTDATSLYRKMANTIISTSLETMPPAHLQYVPQHIVKALEETPPSELHMTDAIVFGDFMGSNGMGKSAIEILEETLKKLKEELGPNHLDTVDATAILGEVYIEYGKMKEAEDILVPALEIQRQLRGEEHLETMRTFMLLLMSRIQLGQYEESLEPLVKLQKMFQEKLGQDKEETLLTANILASTYGGLGKLEEAEEIQKRVLKIQQGTLGEKHPDTLTTFSNLAGTYLYRGKLRESEALLVQILEIRREILGEKHPDVVASLNNLARAYQELGKLKEAEEMQVKVVESMQEMMGWHHPDTLSAASNLSWIYFDLGKTEEALELGTKVLDMRREVLGEHHPDTLISCSNLALSFLGMEKLDKARELLEPTFQEIVEVLGRRHPNTLTVSDNLSIIYRKLGRVKEAEEMQVENLAARRELSGEEHPDTILTSANLAITYHELGKEAEARELKQQVLEIGKVTLGESHPRYVDLVEKLAKIDSVVTQE
ncbi:TPR-like protein [Serendipita vermifera]|nr:TPR-like protein [Serendipita vermifera]